MFSLDKIRKIKMNKINLTKNKKQYYKDYYKNNKERIMQQSKQFYLDNREEICKKRKGTHNEYYKAYYQANKIKRNDSNANPLFLIDLNRLYDV
tara:strand:- start:394 stop:675 length:282 start_codon:yes stop_codon:yes gene_type:complete